MAAEVSTHGKAQCDYQGRAHIHIARFVVLPKSKDADRREQSPQRSPLRASLIHMKEKDQSGYDENTSAGPHDARDGANYQAE